MRIRRSRLGVRSRSHVRGRERNRWGDQFASSFSVPVLFDVVYVTRVVGFVCMCRSPLACLPWLHSPIVFSSSVPFLSLFGLYYRLSSIVSYSYHYDQDLFYYPDSPGWAMAS